MFEVRITEQARRIVERAIAERTESKAVLRIHRQGPVADVVRSANGAAQWQIERSHPFAADVGGYSTMPELEDDLIIVDGIKVWLALIPREGEIGVVVTAKEGRLHVEAIDG